MICDAKPAPPIGVDVPADDMASWGRMREKIGRLGSEARILSAWPVE
jgi:hypothetical protein